METIVLEMTGPPSSAPSSARRATKVPRQMTAQITKTFTEYASWPAGTALTARCVIVLQIGQAFQNKTQLAMTKLEVKKTGHKAVKGCVSAPPLSPPNAVLGALAGPFAHSRSDYSPALSWAVQFVGVPMCSSFC